MRDWPHVSFMPFRFPVEAASWIARYDRLCRSFIMREWLKVWRGIMGAR